MTIIKAEENPVDGKDTQISSRNIALRSSARDKHYADLVLTGVLIGGGGGTSYFAHNSPIHIAALLEKKFGEKNTVVDR